MAITYGTAARTGDRRLQLRPGRAPSVHVQFDRLIGYLTEELPAVAIASPRLASAALHHNEGL